MESEIVFLKGIHLGKLDGQGVTLLDLLLLLAVVLGKEVLGIAVEVLVGTLTVHALGIFQKEFAILGSSKRSPNESAICDTRVHTEHGHRHFLWIRVRDIRLQTGPLIF